jgi:glycosyltransferase involved in cell wall biosynthesis
MPADLDERAVRQILGCLGVELLEVRMLEDSQFSSEKKGEKEWAEKLWEKREDYLRLLAQFNIYLAPRRHEGIGMAYLEAMAMGMCVVAENQPTANEYILSGENGILYGGNEARLYAPRAVAVAKMKQMGRAARDTIAQIHQTWMARRVMISETVKRMSSMEFQRKSPPAEGLALTLGFWQEQRNFWQRFETDLIGPWRSASVERKFKKETSLAGRIRNLWKHQRARAHKQLQAVG